MDPEPVFYASTDDWWWDGPSKEVRFEATYRKQQILCRVTKECLTDCCDYPATTEESVGMGSQCLDTAKQYSDRLTDLAGHLIIRGRFESDHTTVGTTLRY